MKLYQLLNEFQQPIKGTWSDWDTLGNEILKIPNNRVTPQVYRKLIVPAQNQSMYGYVDRNDPSFSQYDIGQMVDADHNIMTGTPSSRSAVKNLPSKAVEYLRTASQKFPILQQKQLDQQRATSKEAIQQNNDALIMLHSSDKDAQIQGARKILNAVLNHNDDATAQEANQVLSSVIQVASTPTTPQAKVNFIRSHLGHHHGTYAVKK